MDNAMRWPLGQVTYQGVIDSLSPRANCWESFSTEQRIK